MNNIVKYGMYFIILTAVGILYERYNRKFNHFDEVRQYELIKKYLLNDSSLASSKKPIIWIHTTYDVNARNWESFYSRSNENINQPYILLCIKSIIDTCGNSGKLITPIKLLLCSNDDIPPLFLYSSIPGLIMTVSLPPYENSIPLMARSGSRSNK